VRKITPDLTAPLAKHFGDPAKIASALPFRVKTFRELVEHTAQLSYKNKDHLLFYRGQSKDYKNKNGSSTFYPSIYRGDYLPLRELTNRFDVLEGASKVLSELFEQNQIEGYRDLKRRKSIQWSILQHYEVCPTPYSDFTHSLRVACSFAMLDNHDEDAFVFAFGLPYITNRISVNSEHDIVNIRLLSICPPGALRPYFQEGYLAGTDDITVNFENKTELDFSNRLVAKFVIPNNNSFWGNGFNRIPKKSLYPDDDPIFDICQKVKERADQELKSGDLGEFLKSWAELEERIVSQARQMTDRFLSFREAIRELFQLKLLSENQLSQLDKLRVFRNRLVHTPQKLKPGEVVDYQDLLKQTLRELKG
jgi:hypothetical protein